MTKAPAYQRYPKDYMSDSNVLRMNFEERGIYDWLLDSCWIEDGIPSDVGELARICSIPRRRMTKVWERVGPCFVPHPRKHGWLTNARLEKERQAQAEYRDAKSKAGQKGARERWHHDASANSKAITADSSAVRSLQSASASTLPAGELRARAGEPSAGGPQAIPDDWRPTDAHRAKAEALGASIAREAARFRSRHRARGELRVDWDAEFDGFLDLVPTLRQANTGNGAAPPATNGAHPPKASPLVPIDRDGRPVPIGPEAEPAQTVPVAQLVASLASTIGQRVSADAEIADRDRIAARAAERDRQRALLRPDAT